jgi:hypothetical protein
VVHTKAMKCAWGHGGHAPLQPLELGVGTHIRAGEIGGSYQRISIDVYQVTRCYIQKL